MSESVAVIGLGRMGGPMADCLAAAGHHVRGFDVATEAMDARADGVGRAASPADAARGADFVSVVVFDDAQAIDVLSGDGGAFAALAPGAIVSVHTTVSLDTIHHLAAAGADRGVVVLDAGISGGEEGARVGTLLTMVGGEAEAVDRARPVLAAFSKEVLHAGPLGAGMALKLARNMTGYAMMSVVHEALELAHRSGIAVDVLRHVIAETGVFAQGLATLSLGGPSPIGDDAQPRLRAVLEHTAKLAAKDLDQTLALASRLDAPLPVTAAVEANFSRAVRLLR